MSDLDLERTRQEIERLKTEIESAKPGEKRRLWQGLLELQMLQLWRITKQENEQKDQELQSRIAAEFEAVRTEHEKVMQTTQPG